MKSSLKRRRHALSIRPPLCHPPRPSLPSTHSPRRPLRPPPYETSTHTMLANHLAVFSSLVLVAAITAMLPWLTGVLADVQEVGQ